MKRERLQERIELLEARAEDPVSRARAALDATVKAAEQAGLEDSLDPVLLNIRAAYKALGPDPTTQKRRNAAYRPLVSAERAAKSEANLIRNYVERQPMLDVMWAIGDLQQAILDMYEE